MFCGCRGVFLWLPWYDSPTDLRGDDTHPAGCRAVPLGQPHIIIVLQQTKIVIIFHAAAVVRQPYSPARGRHPSNGL